VAVDAEDVRWLSSVVAVDTAGLQPVLVLMSLGRASSSASPAAVGQLSVRRFVEGTAQLGESEHLLREAKHIPSSILARNGQKSG